MIPRSFEYYAPRAMGEAVSLLQKLGPEAKILSGGQSLIPMMKLRLASPQYVVDINHIPDLNYVLEADGFLRIGALLRGRLRNQYCGGLRPDRVDRRREHRRLW